MSDIKVVFKDAGESEEYRCTNCNKLLLKGIIKEGLVNIKCPRCGEIIQLLEIDPKIYYISNSNIANVLSMLKAAFDNAFEHIVITDKDAVIFYANKAAEKVTGYSIQEMIGKKAGSKELWGGMMPPEFYTNLWRTISIEKSNFTGELRNRTKDGQIYHAILSISPILDENQEIVSFVAIERALEELQGIRFINSDLFIKGLGESKQKISDLAKQYASQPGDQELDRKIFNLTLVIGTLIYACGIDLNGRESFHTTEVDIQEIISTIETDFAKISQPKEIKFKVNSEIKSFATIHQPDTLKYILIPIFQNILALTQPDSTVKINIQHIENQLDITFSSQKSSALGEDFVDFNFEVCSKIAAYIGGNAQDKSTKTENIYDITFVN